MLSGWGRCLDKPRLRPVAIPEDMFRREREEAEGVGMPFGGFWIEVEG